MTDAVRERFEAWYNANHKEPIHPADYRTDGSYRLGIEGKWRTWQAAQADAASLVGGLVETLNYYALKRSVKTNLGTGKSEEYFDGNTAQEALTKAQAWLDEK
jgi:hypothetical protein